MNAGLLMLNAGSSSIRYALYARGTDFAQALLAGQVLGIGTASGEAPTHAAALQEVLRRIEAEPVAAVSAVGHRIVHGGAAFDGPALIDDAVYAAMAALEPLAPLHQPHGLAGVRAARAAFPGVPQVACFDTAFHRPMPVLHQRFALPQRWHDAGVQRYGFHGLSIESTLAQLRAKDPAAVAGRVVVAHLGNGASMCALRDGQPVTSTMSFSPLDGLTMGTRCGRLDAAVVLHLQRHHGLDIAAVAQLLNHESGLLGLSGLSSDMRELQASPLPAAQFAIDHFVEAAQRELAVMAAALRGIDGLVFTGGIGENAADLRQRIVAGAAWMGLAIDAGLNAACRGGREGRISTAASPAWVRVVCADEARVMARHTARCAFGE